MFSVILVCTTHVQSQVSAWCVACWSVVMYSPFLDFLRLPSWSGEVLVLPRPSRRRHLLKCQNNTNAKILSRRHDLAWFAVNDRPLERSQKPHHSWVVDLNEGFTLVLLCFLFWSSYYLSTFIFGFFRLALSLSYSSFMCFLHISYFHVIKKQFVLILILCFLLLFPFFLHLFSSCSVHFCSCLYFLMLLRVLQFARFFSKCSSIGFSISLLLVGRPFLPRFVISTCPPFF